MTGYGRGEYRSGEVGIVVEMRSVNNRYLDVQIKTPRSLAALEPRIRKSLQERCARGRIDVFVTRSGKDANPVRFAADHELAGQYLAVLADLKKQHGLSGEVDIGMLLTVPEIVIREEIAEDLEAAWNGLSQAMDAAAREMIAMRETEGTALRADMMSRLHSLGEMAGAVRLKSPASVEQARKRMTDAVARMLQEQPDPARIAQEIAMLAERTDVTEELTRLESHIAQFRSMVSDGGDAIGRKLDFLIQEMGREVNTIASKAQDSGISLIAVQMKAELEKVREQAQNVE